MSADNMVYLQRCPDGKWRAWHGFASGDDCEARPSGGFIVETESRSDAIVAAHDWNNEHGTEYGVVEIGPDDPEVAPAKLPPLPKAAFTETIGPVVDMPPNECVVSTSDKCEHRRYYTEDQMRDFYLQGVADGGKQDATTSPGRTDKLSAIMGRIAANQSAREPIEATRAAVQAEIDAALSNKETPLTLETLARLLQSAEAYLDSEPETSLVSHYNLVTAVKNEILSQNEKRASDLAEIKALLGTRSPDQWGLRAREKAKENTK